MLSIFDTSISNQKNSRPSPPLIYVLNSFLLRLHWILVEHKRIKTLFSDSKIIDNSIGTGKLTRIVYIITNRFEEIDDSFIEIFEVIWVKYVNEALLGISWWK